MGRKGSLLRSGAALILALCLAGCAPGGGRVLDVSGENKAMDEVVNSFFTALDARDEEAIAALFSPAVREEAKDLPERIRQLMEVYPGPTDRWEWESNGATQQRIGGAVTYSTYCTVYAVSGGVDYWCWISLMYKNSLSEKEGVTSIRFFTAEELCGVRYDDWHVPKGDGLAVYAERTLDCQVRAIQGDPYKYTPPEAPLDPNEVEELLLRTTRYEDFVERFGEPCAENIWCYYELPPEDGVPQYLELTVGNEGDIISINVVDDRRWCRKFFVDEKSNPKSAKDNPDARVIKRADGQIEIHR